MIDLPSLLENTIPKHMLEHALVALKSRMKPIRILFEQRRVPEEGWEDDQISFLLTLLSWMDSDKDKEAARIGEREGRVASPLISELAMGFCHGVGRAGSISAAQPKATGSSIAYFFANRLALDILRRTGGRSYQSAVVLPLATGMTIGLATALSRKATKKRTVVYPRLDHKAPMKGMKLMGMDIKTINAEIHKDAVRVPIDKINKAINEETAAIVSTTTFFPPREADDVKEIAKIAERKRVYHIINNAYGVQSREIMKKIQGAMDAGRVDAVVQSTDKNFLTPVGGSIIASPNPSFADEISRAYAGRATAAPIIQFLASILSLGTKQYETLRDVQEHNRALLERHLGEIAKKYSERLLNVVNPIAVAMTLRNHDAKKVGYQMYNLRVTGPRVLEESDYGTCCKKYHSPYITMNAAIGATQEDIKRAVKRLEKVLKKQ